MRTLLLIANIENEECLHKATLHAESEVSKDTAFILDFAAALPGWQSRSIASTEQVQ